MAGTLLGIDVGSSSVKVSLLDIDSGRTLAQATSPSDELPISSPQPGWAEQHPDLWWEHVTRALQIVRTSHGAALAALRGIGIAYQMHGLVLVNRDGQAVRPAIIWCDSRAVQVGEAAYQSLGPDACLSRLGNSPGNFTAAKLAWIKQNEPETLKRASYFMLPGDYIALRLTGRVGTTPSGLSEGVLWDFIQSGLATQVLDYFGIPHNTVPSVSPNFGAFAGVRAEVAQELGIPAGTPVTYRAGDQPNNAFALNVLNPGEIAANAGTSGVVYGVTQQLGIDLRSRVNNFLHVNNSPSQQRVGVLMCVNGAGSFYRWTKHNFSSGKSYAEINLMAASSPVGARGILAIPYGNGAERTLSNKTIGASFENLDLNRHSLADVFRAAQEGVVFALCYGVEIMKTMGLSPQRVRAGNANMFQSDLFRRSFATTTGVPLELLTTDGSEGAARGAGVGAGIYSFSDAFRGLTTELTVEPDSHQQPETRAAYENWKLALQRHLSES